MKRLIFSQACLPLKAEEQTQDEAGVLEIKALYEGLVAAYSARDIDAILSFYSSDENMLVFDTVPPTRYVGLRAYRKVFEAFLTTYSGSVEVRTNDMRIEVEGNLAFSHRVNQTSLSDLEGNKLHYSSRVTQVYRKINGKWLIIHEHNSVPVDLLTGKPVINFQ
jgi:uncharacterized protein (TIGR02246 family)